MACAVGVELAPSRHQLALAELAREVDLDSTLSGRVALTTRRWRGRRLAEHAGVKQRRRVKLARALGRLSNLHLAAAINSW